MSYSLNSLKGDIQGTTIGVIKGNTRSLDYGSYNYTPMILSMFTPPLQP